jgi:hypothetical protein
MALLADYIKSLQEQKKLISELGNSGPSLPGLNVDEITKTLADLDENLSKTVDYYKSLAEQEADKEEAEAEKNGIKETKEQKRDRREKKRAEATKKIKDTTDRFIETQKDFVQEQISIIKVNWGTISSETKDLPQTITLATATSFQPAAVGAAVPNPIFNLGVYYQVLKSIGRSLNVIKTAFLNMLIAADKIKFALPEEVTGTLNTILGLINSIGGSLPSTEEVNQPPPLAPTGTEVILNFGEYQKIGNGKVNVTRDLIQVRKGQTGLIIEEPEFGVVKIRVIPE